MLELNTKVKKTTGLEFFKKQNGLRGTFQKWLFLFVTLAFLFSFGISYTLQTKHAEESASSLLMLNTDYIKNQIDMNREKLTLLEQENEKSLLSKAYAVSLLLKSDPGIINNYEELKNLTEMLDFDDLNITDETGVVIADAPANKLAKFDFNEFEDTRLYLKLITDKTASVIEKPRLSLGEDESIVKYRQYIGVPRLDSPGIIQVGISNEQYNKAVDAASLKHLAVEYSIGRTGYLMVCIGDTIESCFEPEWVGGSAVEYGIPQGAITGESGTFKTKIDGEKVFCAYSLYKGHTIITILTEAEMYQTRDNLMAWNSLMYFILFAVVFTLVSQLLYIIVIKGIHQTNNSLEIITAGNLNETVEVKTAQEFVSLSSGINQTVQALKNAIAEAAARIDKELEFAHEIQISALNRVFPPYPNRQELDLFANIYPAKEVGGDFYDFFFINDNDLVVLIADVAGKGIPASLFMMTAKTHIKNSMYLEKSLGEALSLVNTSLLENNDAGMFVTAFVGILDTSAGVFTYVNAGHNTPLIKRAGCEFEYMKPKRGIILAVMEDIVYSEEHIKLNEGDTIFLYTDGVTEATNAEYKLFGEARLKDVLNIHKNDSVTELLNNVKKEIDLFVKTAPQFDDIAMLGLEYNEKNAKKQIKGE